MNQQDKDKGMGARRLFVVVLQAVLIFAGAVGLLLLCTYRRIGGPDATNVGTFVNLAVVIVLPAGAAAWWLYHKLRCECSEREASGAAKTFLLFAPISWAVAMPLSQFAGYAEVMIGTRFLIFAIAAAAVLLMLVQNFVMVALAMWVVRRTLAVERSSASGR
jgi:hypothetical protein